MENSIAHIETTDRERQTARTIGFWSALLTAVLTFISFAIAIFTLPISGPFCQSGCVAYPFAPANIAPYVPHDYVWMYPASIVPLAFFVLVVCFHHVAPPGRRLYSQIGVALTLLFVALIVTDYYLQIAVLQPSILRGETDGLALVTQYNPHGIFIALEDLGYLVLAIAFGFLAAIFTGRTQIERALRWLFTLSAVLVIGGFILLRWLYGYDLEYRFEVYAISIDWLTLIIAGILLRIWFNRDEQSPK